MNLTEIEQEALTLNERDRATLIVSLIESLPSPVVEVTDEEDVRRIAELESGAIEPLTQEDFVRRVEAHRHS